MLRIFENVNNTRKSSNCLMQERERETLERGWLFTVLYRAPADKLPRAKIT